MGQSFLQVCEGPSALPAVPDIGAGQHRNDEATAPLFQAHKTDTGAVS
jgi:hypothetical protein